MSERLITPTKISEWLGCEHSLALYRRGETGDDRDLNELAEILVEKGLEHEQRVLERYREGGARVLDATMHAHETFDQWRERIGDPLSGDYDVIYQMPFVHEGIRGVADFLVRTSEPTEGYCEYEPVDAKLTRSGAKSGHVLQLCFYAEALEALTGAAPRRMHIALGSGIDETYHVEEFMAYWRRIRRQVLDAFVDGVGLESTVAKRCATCDYCAYQGRCESEWRANDTLDFLASARRGEIDQLESAGVRTLVSLATRAQRVEPLRDTKYHRLHRQAALQVETRESGESAPRFEAIEPSDDPTYGRGLERLPAPDVGDVFLDFEGDPFWAPASDLMFMTGLYFFDGDEWVYESFWAHDLEGQSEMVSRLVRWFVDRRRMYPLSHVYHYNHTERSTIERLVDGAAERSLVDDLVYGGYFVDLYPIVRDSFRVGAESYSLKDLERLVGFTRETEIKKGAGAVIEYERWMRSHDDSLLRNIELYNRDDVVATKALRDWVLTQRPSSMPFRDAAYEREGANEELDDLRTTLATFEADSPERLLGHLLSYWSRERSAVVVPFREVLTGDEDALLDAPQFIGGLSFVGFVEAEGKGKLKPLRLHYVEQEVDGEFDEVDARVAFVDQDGALRETKVKRIDREARTLDVHWNAKWSDWPSPRALGLYSYVAPGPKWGRLSEVARLVVEAGSIEGAPPVVRDVLSKRAPRLEGPSPAVVTFGDDVEEIVEWVDRLDSSYLPIQGPPGTGKTYRGGHIVAEMVKRGRRVGITGPSHSAIHNIMREAAKVAPSRGLTPGELAMAKWNGSSRDTSLDDIVTYPRQAGEMFDNDFHVVGGTSWFFANAAFAERPVDLLIIDEAGQVSLADLVAMSLAARNILLLGDPLQLAQVSQAVHPGESGRSALEFVLGDHLTVPEDRGVFIETTRRMHPSVCHFISRQMYEGRLHGDEPTALQVTDFGTGLRWLRAEHRGRTTFAPEEVELVVERIAAMMGGRYVDREGREHVLDETSFMIVAPFNAQRREFRRRLGEQGLGGVEVGTVDKFQGREAVVVFFSMTTSSEDEIVRGKDFLFSRNRLNVAISRARSLAYLVCTEELLDTRASDVETMRLISTVNAFVETASE